MKLKRFFVAVLVLSCCHAGFAEDVNVKVHGIRIVKPVADDDMSIRPFNWGAGTVVSLLLTFPEDSFLTIDADASKITAFTDDKGGDVTKAVKKDFFSDKVRFGSPSLSKDNMRCSIEIDAPGLPSAGATSLHLTGEMALVFAKNKESHESGLVPLVKGTEIAAGPIPLTISATGKPQWGSSAFSVSLQASQNLESIADIKFFNNAGEELEARRGSTSRSSFGKLVTVSWSYNFKEKVDEAKVVVSYWTDRKIVMVPIDQTFGLGM